MIDQSADKIICRGFQFECHLGFHGHEKGAKQKISVDLEVLVSPLNEKEKDKVSAIRFNYFKANQEISKFLEDKRFNLIETVTEEIAQLLLECFKIQAVRVSVTKYPADIPGEPSVTYVCYRRGSGHRG